MAKRSSSAAGNATRAGEPRVAAQQASPPPAQLSRTKRFLRSAENLPLSKLPVAVAAGIIVAIVLAPPVAVAVTMQALSGDDATGTGGRDDFECDYAAPNDAHPLAEDPESVVTFAPVGEPNVQLRLGRGGEFSRAEVALQVEEVRDGDGEVVTAPRRNEPVVLDVRSSLSRSDGAELVRNQAGETMAWVQWRRSAATATLFLCLERDALATEDGGTYTGLAVIDDDSATSLAVPVTVTLAFGAWWWVAAATWVCMWVALGLLFVVKERRPIPEGSPRAPVHFVVWLLAGGGGAVTVLAFGAVVTTFVRTYLDDPDWGGSFQDMVVLGGAVIGATLGVGGLTAAAAGEKAASQHRPDQDSAAQDQIKEPGPPPGPQPAPGTESKASAGPDSGATGRRGTRG